MSVVAPGYNTDRFNSSSRSVVLDEPVLEHEHHHIHHHIDHGAVDSKALAISRRDDYTDDYTYDRERRMSGAISVPRTHHGHDHVPREHRYHHNHRHRHRDRESGRVYSRSDMDLSMSSSRRSSVVEVSGTTDWTVIDVPPGTRRITIETTGSANTSREDVSISHNRHSGVRRSRGLGSELWTEITKDLVTREAIEELKYPFEETEHFYYIFEYLHQEQIRELIELTADIRHERVKDLQFSRIANSGPAFPPAGTHYIEEHRHVDRHIDREKYVEDRHIDRHIDRHVVEERRLLEERPEIVYTDERIARRSRKYYY